MLLMALLLLEASISDCADTILSGLTREQFWQW
jgi:hypothetical protein